MADWLRRAGYRPSQGGHAHERRLLRRRRHQRLEERLEALVERAGPARGDRSARAAAAASPRCSRSAGPTSSAASSRSARPTSTRSPSTRSCGRRSRPSAALGTLGAPGLFKRSCLEGECCAVFWERPRARRCRTGVGFVSVYSRSDGVVDWHACLDPRADEHLEIRASHCGMGMHPRAWRAVADALERLRAGREPRARPRSRRAAACASCAARADQAGCVAGFSFAQAAISSALDDLVVVGDERRGAPVVLPVRRLDLLAAGGLVHEVGQYTEAVGLDQARSRPPSMRRVGVLARCPPGRGCRTFPQQM